MKKFTIAFLVMIIANALVVATIGRNDRECYSFGSEEICVEPGDTVIKKAQYYIIRKK